MISPATTGRTSPLERRGSRIQTAVLSFWGIDSRRDEEGVDAASGYRLVQNPAALLSRLQSLTGQAASPIAEGVMHRSIAIDGEAGVVVSVVPASDRGPHMALLGEHRYYKRSGDSFYKMEHFDIADMFGRRASPHLVLAMEARAQGAWTSGGKRGAFLKPILSIENRGRTVARFPYLRLRVSAPYKLARYGLDGNGNVGLPERARSGDQHDSTVFAGGGGHVIHPGTLLQVTRVELDVNEGSPDLPDLVVEHELACEGARPRQGHVRLSGADLLDLAREQVVRSFPL